MTTTKPAPTVKYGTATLGVGVGNALAYFGLQYAEYKYKVVFDDPVVAMAMAGALVSAGLLELRRVFGALGRAAVYVFNRVYPEKKGSEEPK